MDTNIPEVTITAKDRLDYAWKHFALIADQRLKTFNFYIIILGVAITGTVTVITKENPNFLLFGLLGLSHIVVGSVFWIIDCRGIRMLDIARNALVEIENSTNFDGHLKLVVVDNHQNISIWNKIFSYRGAFRTVFTSQILLGLGMIICSVFTPIYLFSNRGSLHESKRQQQSKHKQRTARQISETMFETSLIEETDYLPSQRPK